MSYIDENASVEDCNIKDSAKVYRFAYLRRTDMDEYSTVADFSKVEDSKLGKYSRVYANGTIYHSNVGDYSYAQKNTTIWNSHVGKFCSISWNVSIGGGEHDYERVTSHSILYAPNYGFVDKPLYDRFEKECIIGNDVWIGAGSHILRGVVVGDGAVVGANSVVTHNVEPYSIVAGVPARKIGQRCSDEVIKELLELKWWDMDVEVLKNNVDVLNSKLSKETVGLLFNLKKQ